MKPHYELLSNRRRLIRKSNRPLHLRPPHLLPIPIPLPTLLLRLRARHNRRQRRRRRGRRSRASPRAMTGRNNRSPNARHALGQRVTRLVRDAIASSDSIPDFVGALGDVKCFWFVVVGAGGGEDV